MTRNSLAGLIEGLQSVLEKRGDVPILIQIGERSTPIGQIAVFNDCVILWDKADRFDFDHHTEQDQN